MREFRAMKDGDGNLIFKMINVILLLYTTSTKSYTLLLADSIILEYHPHETR